MSTHWAWMAMWGHIPAQCWMCACQNRTAATSPSHPTSHCHSGAKEFIKLGSLLVIELRCMCAYLCRDLSSGKLLQRTGCEVAQTVCKFSPKHDWCVLPCQSVDVSAADSCRLPDAALRHQCVHGRPGRRCVSMEADIPVPHQYVSAPHRASTVYCKQFFP